MATLGKAYLHASATHPQRVGRFPISHTFGQPITTHANAVAPTTRGGAYGVLGDDDFKVTTTTGLGWSCSAGRIIATGTSALAQGAYAGLNDAAVTGTLAARDATNPRITLIAYRVRDTDEDATTFEDDAIVMIDGTPAASPADPTLTASLGSLVILSRVTVPSSANGGAPTYSDVRPFAAAIGGVHRVTSSTRPTGSAIYKGQMIYEVDTGSRLWRDSAGWRYAYKPPIAYSPTSSVPALGNGTVVAFYSITENWCEYHGTFTLGTTTSFGAGAFTMQFSLPVPFASAGTGNPTGAAQQIQISTARFFPATIQANTTVAEIINNGGPQSQAYSLAPTVPFVWAPGDIIKWSLRYPIA